METGVSMILAQYIQVYQYKTVLKIKNENKRNLAFMVMLELIGSPLMTYLSNQHLGG